MFKDECLRLARSPLVGDSGRFRDSSDARLARDVGRGDEAKPGLRGSFAKITTPQPVPFQDSLKMLVSAENVRVWVARMTHEFDDATLAASEHGREERWIICRSWIDQTK